MALLLSTSWGRQNVLTSIILGLIGDGCIALCLYRALGGV